MTNTRATGSLVMHAQLCFPVSYHAHQQWNPKQTNSATMRCLGRARKSLFSGAAAPLRARARRWPAARGGVVCSTPANSLTFVGKSAVAEFHCVVLVGRADSALAGNKLTPDGFSSPASAWRCTTPSPTLLPSAPFCAPTQPACSSARDPTAQR